MYALLPEGGRKAVKLDPKLSLDVDSPDKVVEVLQEAIDTFDIAGKELSYSWQDKSAGKPWHVVANEFNKAMIQIKSRLKNSDINSSENAIRPAD